MANPLYEGLFGRHLGQETVFLQLQDGTTFTHGQFLQQAAQYAHVLTDFGLRPGDRVAVQIEKSPQSLAIYAACVQAGLIFLPLNTAYTASELSHFIEDSGARVIICDPKSEESLAMIAQANGARLETMDTAGQGSFAQKAAPHPLQFATVPRDAEDLAAFLYTSGTTGRSKGAMLTQNNLLSNAEVLTRHWAFSDSDVLLHALPIFHTHGLFVATNIALLSGCKILFVPKFDQEAMIALMPQATCMMGVPTFYTRLLDDPRFDRALSQHMRLFISGSAPLLAETHKLFEQRSGHRILERYGMTETNMCTSNPYEGERRAGTVGFQLPGIELKITDSTTGKTLAQGNIGDIEVRGPNVFKGYWNMPEKTAEELRSDGFFITGDLGMVDADGYVHIVGRNKDLIISGGFNIYPKEIETVLDAQEGVLESAVIGVPHPDFGETVLALLVPSSERTPDLDAIQSHISEHLARFKLPKKLIVLSQLPRNTMGKVQKNALRDQFRDLFAKS
jgi:malonyl-CoA/methylmalonyl-CoA synthetase